jgi:hypothetical protein
LEPGEGGTPLTPTPPLAPTTTTPPTTDPTTPPTTDPVEHQGTWENKDEDGDGVPDEQDDYPFDASKSSYELVQEEEFNNNVTQANLVGKVPFRVKGTISESRDIDDFKFNVTNEDIIAGRIFSFIIYKDESKFKPGMVIIKDDGVVLQSPNLAIDIVGRIGHAISFKPTEIGNYNVSVTDRNGNNDVDFTYLLESFVDQDGDGVADELEMALGMDPELQDTDGDDILDGNEFHVFKSQYVRDLDVDLDNSPNWLDSDSDDDGILDLLESTVNFDGDNYPNFVDVDSDNNNVNDELDFDSAIGYLQDSDGDNIPDYADLDDDGDLLLDVYDADTKNQLLLFNPQDITSSTIRNVQMNVNGSYSINRISAYNPAYIYGSNLDLSSEVYVVINKNDNNGMVTNIKVNSTSGGKIEFVVPDYGDIEFGGEDVDLFVVIAGKRTERIRVRLLDPLNPQLYSISPVNAVSEQVVSIVGENFSPGTNVVINDLEVQVNILSSNSGQFTVPKGALTSNVFLKNQYGTSESIYLSITKN